MKKIVTQKPLIKTLVVASFLILDIAFLIVCVANNILGTLLFLLLFATLIINAIAIPLLIRLLVKNSKKTLIIADEYIEYTDKYQSFKILNSEIEYFSYSKKPMGIMKLLIIHTRSNSTQTLLLSKKDIKELAKITNINLVFYGSMKRKDNGRLIKDFFSIEELWYFLFIALGICLTVFGLIFYFNNKNQQLITALLCVSSFIIAVFMICHFTFYDEHSTIIRLLKSFLITAIIWGIFFVLGLIFCFLSLKAVFVIETVVVSFMILSSIPIVAIILFLILLGLSYY